MTLFEYFFAVYVSPSEQELAKRTQYSKESTFVATLDTTYTYQKGDAPT